MKRLGTAILFLFKRLEWAGLSMATPRNQLKGALNCPETDSGMGGRTLPPFAREPGTQKLGGVPVAPEGPAISCNTAR